MIGEVTNNTSLMQSELTNPMDIILRKDLVLIPLLAAQKGRHHFKISELLIRQEGANWPAGENQSYRLYFSILGIKNIPRDSMNTREYA